MATLIEAEKIAVVNVSFKANAMWQLRLSTTSAFPQSKP